MTLQLRKLGKILAGQALVGRVGHFCVEERCRPALVTGQRGKQVQLTVITPTHQRTEQRDVPVVHQRDSARSFHLLDECDKIAIVDGEYKDVP